MPILRERVDPSMSPLRSPRGLGQVRERASIRRQLSRHRPDASLPRSSASRSWSPAARRMRSLSSAHLRPTTHRRSPRRRSRVTTPLWSRTDSSAMSNATIGPCGDRSSANDVLPEVMTAPGRACVVGRGVCCGRDRIVAGSTRRYRRAQNRGVSVAPRSDGQRHLVPRRVSCCCPSWYHRPRFSGDSHCRVRASIYWIVSTLSIGALH